MLYFPQQEKRHYELIYNIIIFRFGNNNILTYLNLHPKNLLKISVNDLMLLYSVD